MLMKGCLLPGSCEETLVCLLVLVLGCGEELLSGSVECLPVENCVKESFSDSAED